MFSEKFILLQQEGFLTSSCLCQGLNFLRKANLGTNEKGLFYSAFFQLSIGIERLMKIIVILDYMYENDLKLLTDAELKNNYGHKIKDLYCAINKIALKHKLCIEQFDDISIENDIMHFLHEFALSARYYNISQLGGKSKTKDPLAEWWDIIFNLYLDEVSVSKRERIQRESLAICDAMRSNSFTLFHALNGDLMTQYDLLSHPRIIDTVAPYSVWYLIKILSPLFSVLKHCQHEVHLLEIKKKIEIPIVPHMDEFFSFLYIDRQRCLRKKNWKI